MFFVVVFPPRPKILVSYHSIFLFLFFTPLKPVSALAALVFMNKLRGHECVAETPACRSGALGAGMACPCTYMLSTLSELDFLP